LDRELILKAIEEAGLEQLKSCCGVEHKYCNSDEWRGNLAAFAEIILRLNKENLTFIS